MTPEELAEQQRVADQFRALQAQSEQTVQDEEEREFQLQSRDFGPERASIEADRPERPEGPLTAVGRVLDAVTQPVTLMDEGLKAAENLTQDIPVVGPAVKTLSDIQPSREDVQQFVADNVPGGKAIVGLEAGLQSAKMLPMSAITSLTGQDMPWNEAPTLIKDDFIAKSVYDISKLATATGIYGRFLKVPGAKRMMPEAIRTNPIFQKYLQGNITDSIIETIAFESPDDYLLARTAAKGYGQVANTLGMDGEEVTRRLLEGEGLGYRSWGQISKFMHNLGMNIFVPRFARKIWEGPMAPVRDTWDTIFSKNVKLVAEETGVPPSSVADIVEDPVQPPAPNKFVEPSEQQTAETVNNTIVKDAVNGTSPTGFMVSSTRPIKDAEVQSNFWQTTDGIGKDKPLGFQEMYEVITAGLRRFPEAVQIRAGGYQAATQFLVDNRSLLSTDYRRFLTNFKETFFNRSDVGDLGLEESAIVTQEAAKNFWADPGANTVIAIGMRDANQAFIDQSFQLQTLDSAGQDWADLLPQMRNNVAAGESLANLYRRWQGTWSAQGYGSQNKVISAIEEERYLDLFDIDRELGEVFTLTDQEALFRANPEIDPQERWITDIFDKAIEGDADALKAVKDLTAIAAIQDPARPMDWANLTSDSIKEAWLAGSGIFGPEARRLYYGLNLLGRIRTAVFAAGSNLARYTVQPIAATIGKPFVTAQLDPSALKNINTYSDDFMLWTGGASNMKSAAKTALKAWNLNQTVATSNARWNNTSMNLKQASEELDRKYQALMMSGVLTDKEANMATIHYLARSTAMHPALHTVPRALMATDEGFKITSGTSWASMMAQRRANELAMNGQAPSDFDWDDLLEQEMKKVFIEGDPMKGFAPGATEAKRYAEMMTFQAPIDKKRSNYSISGLVNDTFGWIEEGASKNPGVNLFFPFMKTVWGLTNQGATMITGAIPGGPALAKAIDPDFREAVTGARGPAMEMMVKSNLAAGAGLFWVTAAAAGTGVVYITRSSDTKLGETRSALVVDHGDGQRVEIALDRMDPVFLPVAMAVSLVQEFKDGHMSRGDYGKAMGSLLGDMSTMFLDKSFLAGLEQSTDLFSVDTFKYTSADSLGSLAGSVFGIGPWRMMSDWSNGFITPSKFDTEDWFGNFMRAYGRRSGFDIYSPRPVITDVLTGRARTNRIQRQDANIYERWFSGMRAELMPFKVNETSANDRIVNETAEYGFKEPRNYLTKADDNTQFENAEQVAMLSNDIYNPQYGDLRGKLKFLYNQNSEYKLLTKRFNKLRKQDNNGVFPRPISETEEAILSQINALKTRAYQDAKKDALMTGRLSEWYRGAKLEQIDSINYTSDGSMGQTSGLYARAAQQDTELARQVRDLLDFA